MVKNARDRSTGERLEKMWAIDVSQVCKEGSACLHRLGGSCRTAKERHKVKGADEARKNRYCHSSVEGNIIVNKGELLQYYDYSVADVCVRLLQHWYAPDLVVRLKLTVHEIRRSNIAKLSRQNLRSSYLGNFMATLRSQRLNSMSIHTSNDRSRELKFISYMKISSLVSRNIIVINYN